MKMKKMNYDLMKTRLKMQTSRKHYEGHLDPPGIHLEIYLYNIMIIMIGFCGQKLVLNNISSLKAVSAKVHSTRVKVKYGKLGLVTVN